MAARWSISAFGGGVEEGIKGIEVRAVFAMDGEIDGQVAGGLCSPVLGQAVPHQSYIG